MTVARGVGNTLMAIGGLLILLFAIVVLAKVLGSDAPIKPIILHGIELRNTDDAVQKAELVSLLDDLVQQAENDDLSDQWYRMTKCLSDGCPDDAYFDLVLATAAIYEEDLPQSPVLINLIATNKYWGDPEQVVEFSRAMTLADDQIRELKSRRADTVWSDIVECNAVCDERNDLFFELIGIVVEQ